MLTLQYLEPSPELAELDPSAVVDRLRAAVDRLPISHLLIGWQLPQRLLEVCSLEAERLGMRFLRWQPLLTNDQSAGLIPSWRAVNVAGERVAGYHGLPEFTFFCPNHPEVQGKISQYLDRLIRQGIYQGFFLDRVRFPSPSADLTHDLACFCEHCQRKAAETGLDLVAIRREILRLSRSEAGRLSLVRALLLGEYAADDPDQRPAMSQFMVFRRKSIGDFLGQIIQPIRDAGLEIGLDCFSPTLTCMVGQDLKTMSSQVDWIKLMTYAHTLAPAGLPYELLGLVRSILKSTPHDERQVLDWVSHSTGLVMPANCQDLKRDGISSASIATEVQRGIQSSSAPILAGIELVESPGITRLSTRQILADLTAIKRAQPAGLALSWDLRHIPLDRLDLIRQGYLENH